MLHPVLNELKKDVDAGHNKNLLIIGAPRTGKSYAALRIAELLDPAFTVEHVVWTIPQFLELINSDKLKDGSAIIFDEAGVSINARNWYEKTNKEAMMILQTYGYRHFIVIFTTPSMSYLDSQSRKLFNYSIETLGVNTRDNTSKVKMRFMQHNPLEGKVYFKIPVVSGVAYDYLVLGKPSAKLCHAYDKKSEFWKSELSKQIEQEIKNGKKDSANPEDIAEEIAKNPKKFMKVVHKKKVWDILEISRVFGIGARKAQATRQILLKEHTHALQQFN